MGEHTRGLWFESRAKTDEKYLSKICTFYVLPIFHTSVQAFDVSQTVEVIEINALFFYFTSLIGELLLSARQFSELLKYMNCHGILADK